MTHRDYDHLQLPPSLDSEFREMLSRAASFLPAGGQHREAACSTCHVTLRVIADERRNPADGSIRCEVCARRLQLKDAREGLPKRFVGFQLESPALRALVGAEAVESAKNALSADRVTLLGPSGAGKTSLVVAMFQHVLGVGVEASLSEADLERARGARFKSAYQLAKARAQHPLGEGEAPDVLDSMNATILVIDELGSERDSALNAVTDVIYERHARMRPTWVTTWLTKADLDKRYGSGIARRLLDGAAVLPLARDAVRGVGPQAATSGPPTPAPSRFREPLRFHLDGAGRLPGATRQVAR
ncbi:hypothetical protein LVJ94_35015 [Pendulispora rubella]|uniref:AAA+ ATPase domain-containing protein n=1 Tax=Pendulispora rubella TaxID=2741070 RepID=A0ABZ2KWF8_9BACT